MSSFFGGNSKSLRRSIQCDCISASANSAATPENAREIAHKPIEKCRIRPAWKLEIMKKATT